MLAHSLCGLRQCWPTRLQRGNCSTVRRHCRRRRRRRLCCSWQFACRCTEANALPALRWPAQATKAGIALRTQERALGPATASEFSHFVRFAAHTRSQAAAAPASPLLSAQQRATAAAPAIEIAIATTTAAAATVHKPETCELKQRASVGAARPASLERVESREWQLWLRLRASAKASANASERRRLGEERQRVRRKTLLAVAVSLLESRSMVKGEKPPSTKPSISRPLARSRSLSRSLFVSYLFGGTIITRSIGPQLSTSQMST